jgi:hypothetical protein
LTDRENRIQKPQETAEYNDGAYAAEVVIIEVVGVDAISDIRGSDSAAPVIFSLGVLYPGGWP